MKIICQSCGAKYTVADEKVRGKTVKIRCKKCSAAIVVRGPDPSAVASHAEEEEDQTRVYASVPRPSNDAPLDEEWTVAMPSGEQRTATGREISGLIVSGSLTDETYAWREGMEDWLPLAQIPELAPALQEAAAEPPPVAQPGNDLFAVPAAAQEARVARVEARGRDQDLFAGAQQAGAEHAAAAAEPEAKQPFRPRPPKPNFTAERGENSVLFSIDTIKAGGVKPAKPQPQSDKIDLAQLTTLAPPGMSRNADDLALPDFSAPAMPSLAAPTLPTGPPPPNTDEDDFTAKKSSNKGLMIALGAAAAFFALATLGIGGYLLTRDESGPQPIAAASVPAVDTVAAPTEPAADKPLEEPTAAAQRGEEGQPDAGAKPSEEASATATKTASATKSPTTTTAAKGTTPSTAKTADPKKTAAAAKNEEPKKTDAPPPPAAAADAPFSRGAAVAALNSAAGSASGCKQPGGPTGSGRVSVTFANSGRVTSAVVNGPPFAGTSVGGCVASAFRRATVPPFTGSPVTVHKSFSIK